MDKNMIKERLQSISLLAVKAINALDAGNMDEVWDLTRDIQDDMDAIDRESMKEGYQ